MKIKPENTDDNIYSIQNSWGRFVINFEVQLKLKSTETLMISTCTRETQDRGPREYSQLKTMRIMDEREMARNIEDTQLDSFYTNDVSSFELVQKVNCLKIKNNGLD